MAGKFKYYHKAWIVLFLAWTVAYADRTLMTPVITWMIANKADFFVGVAKPNTLGGLIGGLFFSGYMLMQFPAGFIGDRHGNKTVIVISIFWAAVATFLTGLVSTLFWFVSMRVFTGLGESTLYSNDRNLITVATPKELRGWGMGIAISGLSAGLTIALLSGSYTITWAAKVFGTSGAWRWPFLLWTVPTIIVGILLAVTLRQVPPVKYEETSDSQPDYAKAVAMLTKYAAVLLIIVMLIYYVAISLHASDLLIAVIETLVALILPTIYYIRKGEVIKPLLERNLLLNHLTALAFLWSFWFYTFWSMAIIMNVAKTGFLSAALIATFNGVAGIIGFPLGGKISDWFASRGKGRKTVLFTMIAVHAILVFIFAAYIANGGKSLVVMGVILFFSGLFLLGLQPGAHALVGELARPDLRTSTFGMYNLIAEVGAVLSPVVSGALKDATGGWIAAFILDGLILVASLVCVAFIRESLGGSAKAKISAGV